MHTYLYETHEKHLFDPLLPFVFHNDTIKNSDSYGSPNWHRNIELLCCISGRGTAKCNAVPYPMGPGDVLVINADVMHTMRAMHPQEPFVYHCLIIDEQFCHENGVQTELLQFIPLIRDPKLFQAFEHLVQSFAQYRENKALQQILEIRHCVLGILCTLCGRYLHGQIPPEEHRSHQRVKEVVTFLRQNLSSDLSLDAISANIGISKFHLSREFKSATGMTVIEFLNLSRCAEAKRLMENGASVSEAAGTCGFANMSYFCRMFKRHFGSPPSAYIVKK